MGDPAREMGPFPDDVPDSEKSGHFLYLNTGKKSITLDLKTAAGVDAVKALVRQSDVLIENFSPRVMPGLGLDYQTLRRENARLVMVSISNFGQTGPYRDFKATDLNIWALSGILYECGDADREPLKMGSNVFRNSWAACTERSLGCQLSTAVARRGPASKWMYR